MSKIPFLLFSVLCVGSGWGAPLRIHADEKACVYVNDEGRNELVMG